VDKLLLFGGSFNPIHHGHVIVGRFVAEYLECARVILVPSATPPHKQDQPLAPAADRLAMCRLAVGDDPQFKVSDWELQQEGPSYTLRTVQHFQVTRSGMFSEILWLIGMDSLEDLVSWHRVAELVDACTIVTAARPGFAPPERSELAERFSVRQIDKLLTHVVEGPQIDIAGTDIRARVRAGRSIRYLVAEAVRDHIQQHGLYGAGDH
jgi:nicotinate-nucleotide adenylyltransferase